MAMLPVMMIHIQFGAATPPAGSGCLASVHAPALPLPSSGWTFYPDGCTWGASTNWSRGGGPGAVWTQPGEMSAPGSQPVVDYNVAFANSPLRPPLSLNFTWVSILWCGVGIVLRARGTADFYELSFPSIGQAQRSEAVWLQVSRVRTCPRSPTPSVALRWPQAKRHASHGPARPLR